jgi:hypothetical protein
MWVLPRIDNYFVLFWEVLEENKYFRKLKYKRKGLFMGVVTTVRVINPLDSNPQAFRIVLKKKNNEHWLLAVADVQETIDKHWHYLVNELLPLTTQIEDDEEAVIQFILSKVQSLATLEEGEEGKNEQKVMSFHELFKEVNLPDDEKLVTYYEGALWEQNSLAPVAGTMYLTENCICWNGVFKTSRKFVINFKDVTSISKDLVLGLLSNSIKISTDRMSMSFIVLRNREDVFNVLEKLWLGALQRWHQKFDPELAKKQHYHTNKAQLDMANRSLEFQKIFRVPDEILYEYWCSMWRLHKYYIGKLFLTDNFICYHTNDQSVKFYSVVIAWKDVETIEKASTFLGLLQNAIVIRTNTMEFFFCASARDEIYEISIKLWRQRQAYYVKKIEASKKTLVNHFGWMLDTATLNSKIYQEEQKKLNELWAKYFEKNGQDTIILTRGLGWLLRQGICDVFRGFDSLANCLRSDVRLIVSKPRCLCAFRKTLAVVFRLLL